MYFSLNLEYLMLKVPIHLAKWIFVMQENYPDVLENELVFYVLV